MKCAYIAIAVLLAACSSGKATTESAATTQPASATPSPTFAADGGVDAASIASHVPDCSDIKAGNVGTGRKTYMSSTATCVITGHLVIFDSYSGGGDEGTIPDAMATSAVDYAHGSTWTAFVGDQGATADQTTLQMQLTNNSGALYSESLDGDKFPPASTDAQKTIAATVATALGGTVDHAAANS